LFLAALMASPMVVPSMVREAHQAVVRNPCRFGEGGE
jgi:hypothetical protein